MTESFSNFAAILSTTWVGPVFVSIFGLIWGSFFNVCIARIPDRLSLLTRSQCPRCESVIPWFCNFPVLSYLFLRARCLRCKKPISIQYPLVEIATAVMFLWLFQRYGLSWQWLSYAVLGSVLLIVSVIDLYLQIIPDELSLPGIVVGFLFALLTGDVKWWESLLGILVGGGSFLAVATIYEKMAKREGLGGGDVKLLAMIGAWLGWQSILPVVVISSALGSVVGLTLMAVQKKNFKAAIPFGPFLAAAAWIFLIWSVPIYEFLFPVYE